MTVPDDSSAQPPARLLTPEQREAAVARLSAAFARDVLTVSEYERRLTEVYRAGNAAALAELTADLPGAAAPSGPTLGPTVHGSPQILALFSNVVRAGRIAIPPHVSMQSVFGNIELDLRDAEFRLGVTDIEASAIFGNVEVLLPEGVTIENHGNAFLGSYSAIAPSRPVVGQPSILIRVNGISIFGNVEFKVGDKRKGVRSG